uniref:Uncharacterized protein n=1 Tax=Electrophorus electricus TaxID=8005 RepID=A0A4W4FUC3_ELEEL
MASNSIFDSFSSYSSTFLRGRSHHRLTQPSLILLFRFSQANRPPLYS